MSRLPEDSKGAEDTESIHNAHATSMSDSHGVSHSQSETHSHRQSPSVSQSESHASARWRHRAPNQPSPYPSINNRERLTGKLRQSGADGPLAPHTHTPHGDAQRQALTLVAFHLIAEGGLERFRTREVAKRAGVNIATLHYYFPSKEDLIRSVVDYLSNEFATRRPPFPEPGGQPLTELRRELIDSSFQLREFPEIFLALFDLFMRGARDPIIREIMLGMDAHWHEHVVAYMAEGVRQGVFRAEMDPNVAAWELIAVIKGCGLQFMINPDSFPIERVHAEVEHWFIGYANADD